MGRQTPAEATVEAWQANHRFPDAVPGPEVKGHQRAWAHGDVLHVSPAELAAFETEADR